MKDNGEQFFAECQSLGKKIDAAESEIDRLNQLCLEASHTMTGLGEAAPDPPRENCWQFKQCGREAGGLRIAELGVCPAAVDTGSNGMNRGENAGRYCWKVAGTLCDEKARGASAQEIKGCENCQFYQLVCKQETVAFVHEWD